MPDSSFFIAPRPETSESSAAARSIEVQLASAEKEVSIVMDSFEYDELITIASDALALRFNTPTASKAVIKSRKNLLWARSHGYHHKGQHALALKDARAALKLDPNNPASYLRTAVLLHNAGHKAQALGCLDRATLLADSCDPSTRAIWQRRIDKQRQKFSASAAFHIHCLPNEVLIAIARHLPQADRFTMSQICRHWRQLMISDPSLWQELIVAIKSKKFPEAKAARWLEHIRNMSKRANDSLKSAAFVGFFPGRLLSTVLMILRSSYHSLEHISIPASHHESCYALLYEFCPNLKSLDAMDSRGIDMDHEDLRILQDDESDLIPDLQSVVFQLEKLSCDPHTSQPHLSKHLLKVRSLRKYCPSGWDPEIGSNHEESREEQVRLLLSLANSLEEWSLADAWPSHLYFDPRVPHGRSPPVVATFSKLKILDGYTLNANFRFDFPELQVLQDFNVPGQGFGQEQQGFQRQEELARMLLTCPKLRILEADFSDLDGGVQDLFKALRSLHNIQELRLSADGRLDFISRLLLPYTSEDESGRRQVFVPYLNLVQLEVSEEKVDVTRLASVLLHRELLRQGYGFNEASDRVRDTIRPATSATSAPAISPFQRASRTDPVPQAPSSDAGPRLADTTTVRPLEYLRLYCIDSISPRVEQALRGLAPNLFLEYEGL